MELDELFKLVDTYFHIYSWSKYWEMSKMTTMKNTLCQNKKLDIIPARFHMKINKITTL